MFYQAIVLSQRRQERVEGLKEPGSPFAGRIFAASDEICGVHCVRKSCAGWKFKYLNKADIARIRRAASNALQLAQLKSGFGASYLVPDLARPRIYILCSALNMLARWYHRNLLGDVLCQSGGGRHAQGPASLALYLHSVGLFMPSGEVPVIA